MIAKRKREISVPNPGEEGPVVVQVGHRVRHVAVASPHPDVDLQ